MLDTHDSTTVWHIDHAKETQSDDDYAEALERALALVQAAGSVSAHKVA